MNADQFRAALHRAGISQSAFARILNCDGRTVRAWALDEHAVPNAVAVLLHLVVAGKITSHDIEKAIVKTGR